MEIDLARQLILWGSTTLFTFFILSSAVHDIFGLGKSRSRIKKEKKSIPLVQKLNLKGYVVRCKYHQQTAKIIRFFYLMYWLVVIAGIISFILISLFPSIWFAVVKYVYLKVFICDIPSIVFFFIFTKHDKKHGGVMWKWTTN